MKPVNLTLTAKTEMAQSASDYINGLAMANGFSTAMIAVNKTDIISAICRQSLFIQAINTLMVSVSVLPYIHERKAIMLKELIRNTKPEIIVSIQDDYLDHVGDEPLSRYVDLTWQWRDDKGNWASLEVLGAVDDAPDGNFDIATLDYAFEHCQARCSDGTLSVSTHSRPKAAGSIVISYPFIIKSFNTQPPEGGWSLS